MPAVVAALTALASWMGRFFMVGVVSAIGIMFSNVIFGFAAQLIGFLSNVVTGTSVELPSVATAVGSLPPEMLSFMKRVRLDDAFSIILASVTVRVAASAFQWVRALRQGSSA